MAKASDVYGILYQNLVDAGCSEEEITACMDYAKKDNWKNILSTLTHHKKALLEQVHTSEKQIDCLDFLIYRLNKEFI
ncbi:MAG: hypothetical protein HDT40_06085 [Lachnospiraceae bacterium]|nr:hypothetical protein [Lachnospiraceae bacterium]